MNANTWEDKIAARQYFYAVAHAVFGKSPTHELLTGIDTAVLEQALQVFDVPDAHENASVVTAALASALQATEEDLRAAYTRLFEGPNKLAAPPWESVYRSNSRALFQRTTLEVRNAYREQGLLPAQYPRVADDHIALELGFLEKLAERAQKDTSSESSDRYGALVASERFLQDHLLLWIDAYAADVSSAAPDSIYAALGVTVAKFSRCDAETLHTYILQHAK